MEVNSSGASGATGYDLYRKINSGSFQLVLSNVSLFDLESYNQSVTAGSTYYWYVVARNAHGTTNSNEVNILVDAVNCSNAPTPPGPPPPPPPPAGGGPCTHNSTVSFLSPIPSTLSPGQNASFTIRVTNAVGASNTKWYHGDGFRFVQQTGFSVTSTAPAGVAGLNYGHLPYATNPGDYVDWTFNITAPTTPSSYTLNMRMMHYAGWNYLLDDSTTCPGPGSNTYFGQTATANFTVVASGSSVLNFNILYTLKPLNPPTNLTIDNSVCGDMTLEWDYTSNGAEDGFVIYRSTDGSSWTAIDTVGAGVDTYTDSPPTAGVEYYYMVRTHRAIPVNPTESVSSNVVSAFNLECLGDLSPSSMTLIEVNGSPYTSTTKIEAGDTLTYQITIINLGPSFVTINAICGNPSDNLPPSTVTNRTVNSAAVTSGAVAGPVQLSSAFCTSRGHSGLNYNVTGTKNDSTNWIITFDTDYEPVTSDTKELIINEAVIYYTDTTLRQKTVRAQNLIVSTSLPQVPKFKEVAP
jgi:uncharacterized repeat protein (TIGR01451 family)